MAVGSFEGLWGLSNPELTGHFLISAIWEQAMITLLDTYFILHSLGLLIRAKTVYASCLSLHLYASCLFVHLYTRTRSESC